MYTGAPAACAVAKSLHGSHNTGSRPLGSVAAQQFNSRALTCQCQSTMKPHSSWHLKCYLAPACCTQTCLHPLQAEPLPPWTSPWKLSFGDQHVLSRLPSCFSAHSFSEQTML